MYLSKWVDYSTFICQELDCRAVSVIAINSCIYSLTAVSVPIVTSFHMSFHILSVAALLGLLPSAINSVISDAEDHHRHTGSSTHCSNAFLYTVQST